MERAFTVQPCGPNLHTRSALINQGKLLILSFSLIFFKNEGAMLPVMVIVRIKANVANAANQVTGRDKGQ